MFQDCLELEEAPDLPAVKLAEHCYSHMFNGCVKLKKKARISRKIKDNEISDCINFDNMYGLIINNESVGYYTNKECPCKYDEQLYID